jgi:hypothetical protein
MWIATRLLVLAMASPLGAPAAGVVLLDSDPALVRAVKALGGDVEFFTPRGRPLHSLGEIRDPGEEMGTGDLGLVRPLLPVLRAGGVKVSGGALDLMRLVSPSHFSSVFGEHPRMRLFAVRRRADGSEQAVAARGGGVPVAFRGAEPAAPPSPSRPAPPSPGPFVTSFGPLMEATVAPTARARIFDPVEGAREEQRAARPGRTFLVLHIDRDFGGGEGVVGFLFGSGTILKPEFERLHVVDAGGRRYPVSATHADGRALELSYEVPVRARGLVLVDGDRRQALEVRAGAARAALAE